MAEPTAPIQPQPLDDVSISFLDSLKETPQNELDLITQSATPVQQTVGNVVNVDLMAASMAAASEGRISLRDATIQATTEFSGKAVRDLAATLYNTQINESKAAFSTEAAKGNLVAAEMYARSIDDLQKQSAVEDPAKSTSVVVKEAALNTATTNEATRKNNTIQKLAKIVEEKGQETAAFEIVSQAIVDVYGKELPGIGSIAAMFGGTIGLPVIAGAIAGGPAGTLTAAGVGSAYFYETVHKPTRIIEEVTGIVNPEKKFGVNYGYVDQRKLLDVYVSTLPYKEQAEVYSRIAERMLSDLNPALPKSVAQLFALMNVAKLYDSIDSSKWKDGDIFPTLSLKMQQTIDQLSLGLDAVALLQGVRRLTNVGKVQSELSGGSSTGARVGDDIAKGQPTPGMTSADQTSVAVNIDVSKVLDQTFGGTEGTEASAVQLKLKERFEVMLKDLNNQVKIGPSEEAQKIRDVMHKSIQMGMDGSIAHYNPKTNTLVFQHPTGKPFQTQSVAEDVAEWASKQSGQKFEVVPANDSAIPKLTSLGDESVDYSQSLDMAVQEARFSNRPMTAREVLKTVQEDTEITHIASKTSKPADAVREVAKLLESDNVLKNVKVELVKDESAWADIVTKTLKGKVSDEVLDKRIRGMSGLMGLFEPNLNKVYVLDKVADSPSLMLHELAHARLGGVLEVALKGDAKAVKAAKLTNEQVAAAKNLELLYGHINAYMAKGFGDKEWKYRKGFQGSSEYYGFANVHEMASEVLSVSNKEFRDTLRNIPVSKSILDEMKLNDVSITGKVRNAFDVIVHTLAKIFGFKAGNDSFTHILDQIARLSREVDLGQQNMVAQLRKGGLDKDAIAQLFSEPFAAKLSHGFFVRHVGSGLKHTQAEIDSMAVIGVDPAHTASRLAVAEKFIAQQTEAKDRETLAKFVKDGFKGLSNAEMRRVEKALEEGDAAEKEFSVVDLLARGFNDKQQRAYFTYRVISNLNHVIKNNIEKANSINKGFSQQAYINLGGGVTDTSPAKSVQFADFDGKRAYDLDTGTRVIIDANNIPVGKTLTMTENKIAIGKVEHTLFVGTPGQIKWGGLLDPIPYREGTFRRIYTDDVFALVSRKVDVNGTEETVDTALRTARSLKDANKWAKGMNEILDLYKVSPTQITTAFIESKVGKWENAADIMADINAGKWDGYDKFQTKYSRSAPDLVESLAKGLHDGKRNGTRGEQRLKAIDDINRPNTLPPLQALEAEVGNVAFLKNVNEWRNKWVDTWYNTFSDLIPENVRTSGRTPLQILSDPNWQLSSYRGSDAKVRFAENQRQYILQQLGTETLSERMIKHGVERITSAFSEEAKLLGIPVGKPMVVAGHWMRQADPLQFLRSFNFYTMLSGMNVSQLIVQAAGAGTAVAIHPIHGMKAAYMAPLLRVALMSDNPAVWATIAKVDSRLKLGLTNPQEFMDTVAAIHKSGLLKGIASTSMHNIEGGAYNMFGGAKSTLAEIGAMPFNRGEEFARLVSFDVARREFIQKNPGVAWNTNDALKQIITRTDDYTMNMTNANKAWFQRGVWSIPAQFLQYNIKLVANLTDGLVMDNKARTFNRSESLSVLGFHTLMYGAVGVGSSYLADEVTGGWETVVGRKATSDEKFAISQGMLSALINEVSQATTGEDLKLAMGSRLGGGEFYENLFNGLLRGEQSLWQTLLGPSASSIKRAYGALGDMLLPFARSDYSSQSVLEAWNDVGKGFFSSWRNATKAYVAKQNGNKIVDEYGVPVAALSGPEIWAQAIGLGTAAENEYYRDSVRVSEHRKTIKEIADTWKQANISYVEAKIAGDNDRAEKLDVFMNSIKPINAGDLEIFDAQVKAREATPFPYVDKLSKLVAEYMSGRHDLKETTHARTGAPVTSKDK